MNLPLPFFQGLEPSSILRAIELEEWLKSKSKGAASSRGGKHSWLLQELGHLQREQEDVQRQAALDALPCSVPILFVTVDDLFPRWVKHTHRGEFVLAVGAIEFLYFVLMFAVRTAFCLSRNSHVHFFLNHRSFLLTLFLKYIACIHLFS